MPANIVKSPADEKKWSRAKSIVMQKFQIKNEADMPKSHWGLVTTIFKNMKGDKKNA